MNLETEAILRKGFLNIKVEDGKEVVHLNEDVDKDDLLEFIYYNRTMQIEKENNLKITSLEKNRFVYSTICFECGVEGHVSKECPNAEARRCPFCDEAHVGGRCSLLFCCNCGNLGHLTNSCRERDTREITCDRCNCIHDIKECPLRWRKYKITSFNFQSKKVNCPECLSDDHLFGDCKNVYNNTLLFSKDCNRRCMLFKGRNNSNNNVKTTKSGKKK